MAEYISKDKAINAIKSLISSMPAKDNYAKGYDAALGRALIAVREVPPAADVQPVKIQSVNRWISVDEALPVIERRVLVYYPNWIDVDEEYQVAHLEETYGCGIQFVTYDGVRLPTVTHWKPLPEPPKDGDAE